MDPWEVAQAQVAVKYDPQQANLQRQIDMAKSSTATNEQALQGYGTAGRQIIGDTYSKLYDWLNYGKATQQQELGQQVANTNAGYDQAIQQMQGYQTGSRNYLQEMAAALGQSGQGLVSGGKLEDSINQQLGRASASKLNYGSGLADWTAKMGSIADMGISAAHQGEAQGRSTFESELLQLLGQNKYAGTIQETDAMNKLSDIMGLRQSDLIAMYNELYQAEWQRRFSQAQLEQEASIAQAQLDQAAAEGAANRSASANDDSLAWAKFNYDKEQNALDRAEGRTAADLAQSNQNTTFDIERQKLKPQVDRQALGQDLWDNGTFGNDTQRYLRFIYGDDSALNAPAAAARSGGSGLNLGRIGSNFKNMVNSPGKAALTFGTSLNPVGYAANTIRGFFG